MEVLRLAESIDKHLLRPITSNGRESIQCWGHLIEERTSCHALQPLHFPRCCHVESSAKHEETAENDKWNGDKVIERRAEDKNAKAVAENFQRFKARRWEEVIDDAEVAGHSIHNDTNGRFVEEDYWRLNQWGEHIVMQSDRRSHTDDKVRDRSNDGQDEEG